MSAIQLRLAEERDLDAVVALLAADSIASARETGTSDERVRAAFRAIGADDNNHIVVADRDGEIVGCLQLTYIPGLTYSGGTRAHVEGVRVAESRRGTGLGRALMEDAVERAKARGCVLIQLTTDKRRDGTVAFYERLGFTASHTGMKMWFK